MRDVIALSKENDFGIVVIVRIRNGRITSREKLSMSNLDENDGATIKHSHHPILFKYRFHPI